MYVCMYVCMYVFMHVRDTELDETTTANSKTAGKGPASAPNLNPLMPHTIILRDPELMHPDITRTAYAETAKALVTLMAPRLE